MGGEKQDI